MVTHEPDIACYARKRIYVRDGQIVREERGKEGADERQWSLVNEHPAHEPYRPPGPRPEQDEVVPDRPGHHHRRRRPSSPWSVSARARRRASRSVSSPWAPTFSFVSSGSRNWRGIRTAGGSWQTLTVEDAEAIAAQCDAVKYISPSVSSRAQVIYANKNWNTSVQGVGARYPEVRNWELEEGAFFDESQVTRGRQGLRPRGRGQEILFEDEDPIGKIIRVKGIPFRVIGVLKSKGESRRLRQPRRHHHRALHDRVMKRLRATPTFTTSTSRPFRRTGRSRPSSRSTELLRIRHQIAPGREDDFQVRNMAEIAEGAAESTAIMTHPSRQHRRRSRCSSAASGS